MQEEEDAALAAALAEQEQAAGVSAAQVAAQQSSSFWSRLQPAGGAYLHGSGGSGAAATAPAANSSFPALQAQLPNDPLAAARAEHTRRQLLARHRAAKQATIERGSGVRLLHRGGGPASAAGSPALAPAALQGSGAGGGLPPLQLVGGLVLHEDDLDYQLLLRHADVTAAARAAAIRHMDLTEAAAEGGGPADTNGPTSAAMRAMIDVAARRAAGGPGGSRPGSAQAAAAPAPADASRPGSSASGGAGGDTAGEMPAPAAAAASAGSGVSLPAVVGPFINSSAPVDTKSFRRLVEDMRSRGWQMLGSTGGGHLRCERVLPDLGGFKQVYFSRGGRSSGRCCAALDLFIAALLVPWWFTAAVIATVYGVRADNANVPHQGARTAVWALAWAQTGLWLLSVLVALATRRACRRVSETELTASLAGGSRYARYNDTPFNDRSSKASSWRDAKAAYLSARSLDQAAKQRQLDP
ncbi:hypothetical protein ABPG75_008470 [Micractinium tetrahymenae]